MNVSRQRLIAAICITIALAGSFDANAQVGNGKDQPPRADESISGEPKELVALNVWVLTLADSAAAPADELTAKLDERANSLTAVVGTIENVRDLVGKLKVAGLLKSSREIRLMTLDGETAHVQTGANMPRVVATNIAAQGRVNNLMMDPVGTTISAQAKIDSDSLIQVRLDYSASDVIKSKDVAIIEPNDGSPTFADIVVNQQLKTSARLASGSAVLVQGDAESGGEGAAGYRQLIILGAAIVQTPK